MTTNDPNDRLDAADDIHNRVRAGLAREDQRYTTSRRQLVALLVRAERPVTLPELLDMDPELPQSSAYRNLEVLERTGLVRRISAGADHAHYELAEPLVGHHHHLICLGCGKVLDIRLDDAFEASIDKELERVGRLADFTPSHHNVDLYGNCSDCQG
ncbi:MAG: Fur family transcriptional regulator [Acidimicrobiales bacterium]